KILVDGARAAVCPEPEQIFQALDALFLRKWSFVPRQAAQNAQAPDAHHHAVLGRLLPDSQIGTRGMRRLMVFNEYCRASRDRLLVQKILHRFPEEDWRMQSNRFVAD
ncbi:MAG: hypothetical protein AAFN16_22060, partial [Pseudomonadota bacterium]